MKDKWMRKGDFEFKYNIRKNHINVIASSGGRHWIKQYHVDRTKLIQTSINVGYLERVEDFRMNITEEAHNLYYEALELFGKQLRLSSFLANNDYNDMMNWNDFLTRRLFVPRDEKFGILDTRIAKRLVLFVRKIRRLMAKDNRDKIIKDSISNKNYGYQAIEQYSLDGVYIKSFKSIAEASRQTGESSSHISLVSNGNRGNKNGKFKWEKRKVDD